MKYHELTKFIRANSFNLNIGTQYIIEPNDNLYEIALRFNTSAEKLKELNNLDSDFLRPGEIIVVDDIYNPSNKDIYKRYTIKNNDTIYSIAYNFGMTTNQVLEINNMLKDDIKAGETIFVYNNQPLLADEIFYVVKKGDTLSSISIENEVSVEELKKNNNLTSDQLSIGQQLLVPKTSQNERFT